MLAILAESALRALLLGGVVWIGLNLMRVRNPHVHMTCWAMVLVASLSMPLLMHWTTVTVTVDALPVPAAEHFWPAGSSWSSPSPEPLQDMPATAQGMPAAVGGTHAEAMNWQALATAVYALVAGLLLLRLAVGLYLTWRLARAAKPMYEPWTADWSVRVSSVIAGPVTFGSTILLPPQCFDWDVRKRQAVLAHEGAHVANRDFYLLLLASLNRSVFWFSPFAWWHHTRLAELAEIISDATALEVVEDRLSYAEILLDLVQHVRRAPAGIEMARACTVRSRVERILAATDGPGEAGLGQAHRDRSRHPAGCHRLCRLDRLSRRARVFAVARALGRARHGRTQAAVRLLLFIGPRVDLHRLPGRRRVVRPGQRAAKAPPGRGGRRHLFLPGAGRPDPRGRRP